MTVTNITYPAELPIVDSKDIIIQSIKDHQVVIITGDTGSGKTTQIPKMCLEAGRGKKKRIGCTQPRRLAATAMAARVGEELIDAGLRHTVGYKIRFRSQINKNTRIKFMTDGILLAETQADRFLNGYDTLIIDEAHERSLNIDFLLGYLKRLLKKRKDLKVIVTSATIDTEKFSDHFNHAPIIEVSGRTYPVEVRYRPIEENSADDTYIEHSVKTILDIRQHDRSADILLFMPTEHDIRETADLLTEQIRRHDKSSNYIILPLYGRMHTADQNRVFKSYNDQKIVIATNVAETSLTVPGIRYVIDTGLARIANYNVRARTTSLPISPVSRAGCDQRKGRCGRISPGICYRLFSAEDYNNRPEFTAPEVLRSNLAEVILRMIALQLGNPSSFPFIDQPAPRAIRDGYTLLIELGALDSGGNITARGKLMARLPLVPTLARMIIEARDHNALREIIIIASALTIQDPRTRPTDKEDEADRAHAAFADPSSDFLSFLKIWDAIRGVHAGKDDSSSRSTSWIRKFCKKNYLSFLRVREWYDIHEQLTTILSEEKGFPLNTAPASYDAIHQSLLCGYIRNIGFKKSKNIYTGAQGKELTMFPGSSLYGRGGQWIMAAEQVETSKLFARTVANIKVEWLEKLAGPLCRYSYSSPRWEKKMGRVIVDEKVSLFGLVIVAGRKTGYARTSPAAQQEARQIFIQSALVEGQLQGNYSFLIKNRALVSRLENMEERMRQRGLLADESVIFDFYDNRLTDDICDQAGLNLFLKKKKNNRFLLLTEEELLRKDLPHTELEAFPGEIILNDMPIRLQYRFNPGQEDDGITAFIPVDLLAHLRQDMFEWLVPGLLADKITFLLKGLPKSIRKKLIPVAATAEKLLQELQPYQGNLHRNLARLIDKRYQVQIMHDQWPTDTLPDHLRMRFCMQDRNGRPLKCSRTLAGLTDFDQAPRPESSLEKLNKQWQRQVSAWDFDNLPESIPLQDRGRSLSGFAYPGLLVSGDIISIHLFENQDECRQATSAGLLALYSLQFPRLFGLIKKECVLTSSDWHLQEGFGSGKEVNQQIYQFILRHLFDTGSGLIPDRQTFAQRVERLKQEGLLLQARKIHQQIINVLRQRRETLDHISRFEQPAAGPKKKPATVQTGYRIFRDEVASILPTDFLEKFSIKRLQITDRYFRALRIRVERAHASWQKDEAKAKLLRPHQQRFNEWKWPEYPSPETKELFEEYRILLDEYKISLFAQEMKTIVPTSSKRLDKKWRELQFSI